MVFCNNKSSQYIKKVMFLHTRSDPGVSGGKTIRTELVCKKKLSPRLSNQLGTSCEDNFVAQPLMKSLHINNRCCCYSLYSFLCTLFSCLLFLCTSFLSPLPIRLSFSIAHCRNVRALGEFSYMD